MSLRATNALDRRAGGAHVATLVAAALLSACAGPSGAPYTGPQSPAEQASRGCTEDGGPAQRSRCCRCRESSQSEDPDCRARPCAGATGEQRQTGGAGRARPRGGRQACDRRLQLERGLLALELGDAARAEKLLRQAHDPKAPDWRLHSALGAALASRGKQQEAQVQFAKALALAPDQPSVLNNLALSYALDGKAAEAEQLLRKAQRSAGRTPQMQENLALVLGLRGRYERSPIGWPGRPAAGQGGAERGVSARAGPGAVRGGLGCSLAVPSSRSIPRARRREPAAAELPAGRPPGRPQPRD